ncbi:uncharacterized protein CPUR_04210 [Claviceps purpurea 20.1]|uniref:Uncharacterized protein n=1 Tax=Claviceps purpurea (strain 20.1) TaxID=1111077 RepID=M1VVZ1_CLAP2|nr:uncharacterized protein CPUR_04210 [Claviceps purpurea 20.1]
MSGEDDINEFISKVNTLADKADIRKTARKATLFNLKIDGIGLKANAFCDTGAGIYLSMTPEFAQRAVKTLKGKIMKLPKPLQLADFSNTEA